MYSFPVSQLFPPLGQGPIVGLPLAALIVVQDHGPDQGLTLILPADPGPVLAPMIDLIPVRHILGAMGVATDALGLGRDPVPGLTATGVPLRHGPLSPTGEVVGREEKERGPTGRGQDRGPLGASGAAPQMGENHLRVNLDRMSWRVSVLVVRIDGSARGIGSGRRSTPTGTTSTIKILKTSIHHCIREVVAVGTGTERGKEHHRYLEIIPPRGEGGEEETIEVLLIIRHLPRHLGQSPVLKSSRARKWKRGNLGRS